MKKRAPEMNREAHRLSWFITTLVILLFPACSPTSGPLCTKGEIREYFVNPSSPTLALLSGKTPDSALFNASLRLPFDSATTGDLRIRLADSTGISYGVGFRTPARLRCDTVYPLIIYLHGGTGSLRTDKGDSAFLMLDMLSDSLDIFLASPSANRYSPWWSPAGLSRILQTLRYMTLHYPVDPDKVFLAGVSDGATGCYAAANTINAPFAGFIAVSGFGGMLPGLGMRLSPVNIMQRPIYNINAGRDHIYPIEQVNQFVADLRQQGVTIIDNVYPDEQHGFDYRDREKGTLIRLIRTWSRPHTADIAWQFIPGFPNLPGLLVDWRLSSGNAYIRTLWEHDTLVVKAQGVTSFTIPAALSAPEKLTCRLEHRTKTVAPHRSPWPLTLRFMINRAIPTLDRARFYTIVTE